MNYSTKVRKYYDGMQIYETLIEDEQAIYLIFALGFKITITAILNQIDEYMEDLNNGILQEIPDYDIAKVTNLSNYFRTGKLRYDMEMLKDQPIMEHLQSLLGSGILGGTSADLCDDIVDKTKLLVDKLKQIDTVMHEADPAIFGSNFFKLMNRHDWSKTEKEYQKEKNEHGDITMNWLLEKQEQELQKVLQMGIMDYAKKPSALHLESVDYSYHRGLLSCDFEDNLEYKKAYAKMMQYAARKDKLLLFDFKNYGKYIALNLYKFRPEQKFALFEIVKKLELIQKDMVRLEPELGEFLGINKENPESLENTKFFAPYFHLKEMLTEEWFKKLRADAKYNDKWAMAFSEALVMSDFGLQIANSWSERGNQIKGYVIGCLKEAGVFRKDVSNDCIARDAGIMSNTRTFGKYIGKESKEQPYAKWIIKHVNDYC